LTTQKDGGARWAVVAPV